MCKKCCFLDKEIPLSELRQQLKYARVVSSDLFKIFSPEIPDISGMLGEYQTIRSKLSMLLDFLFQADLWCDTLDTAGQSSEELATLENKNNCKED